jgi:hypothetical protein
MFGKHSNHNSSQPTVDVALLPEHIVELEEQNEELMSGGGFSGADRLRSTFNAQNHAKAEPLSSNAEYDRFGIMRTESRTY